MEPLAVLAFWVFGFGVAGSAMGGNRKIGSGMGFLYGALLGPIGLIMIATSPGYTVLDKVETRPEKEGWYQDPLGRFDSRFYDGANWTQHVGRTGADGELVRFEDPL